MKKHFWLARILSFLALAFCIVNWGGCSSSDDSDDGNSFTVTYLTAHGNTPSAIKVNDGTALTESQLPALSADGYTFGGWVVGSTKVEAGYKVTSDITLTALWTAIPYSISFETNDGTFADSCAKPESYTIEDEITLPSSAKITKSGYAFKGWFENADDVVSTSSTTPTTKIEKGTTGDKTFYAKWVESIYSIKYEGTDGATLVDATIENGFTKDDTEIPLPTESQITKSGYTFGGWFTDSSYSTSITSLKSDSATKGETLTLYAKWTANTNTAYKVKHLLQNVALTDYEEQTSDEENLTGTTDEATSATAKTYPGFTAKSFEQGTISGDGSTVVSVYYDRNEITLTLNLDGGSGTKSLTGKYGTEVTAPENPTKSGYTFNSWTPALPSTFPAENATYTATWTLNTSTDMETCTITYELYGGSFSGDVQTTYNKGTIFTLPTPAKSFYDFKGWSESKDAVTADYKDGQQSIILNKDTTLYALWEVNETLFKEYISSLPEDTTVAIEGILTNVDLNSIGSAIKDGSYKINLDLSDTTGLTIIGEAFKDCTNLASIIIPDSVKAINTEAFSGCTSLASVTIPDSVTYIGMGAFSSCTGLKSVYIADIAAWCNILFYDTPLGKGATLYLNEKILSGELVIPDGVTTIGFQAFYNCTSLTSVTIPASVTSIEYSAFSGCTSLTSVTIPDSVTSIGDSAFSGCTSLASVTIPASVTSIGSSAFSGCTSLSSVTIPDSVTSIRNSAFYGCSSLTSITIPDGVTSIGQDAFFKCTSLSSVTIPDSVTSIEQLAFYNCTSLTSVTIPDGVTSIVWDAFSGCGNLENITVSAGNKTYDSRNDCNAIIITSTNTLLRGCKNTVIPDSITSIVKGAFSGCKGLTEMTIPFVGGSADASEKSAESKFYYIFIPINVSSSEGYNYVPKSLKKVTVTGGNIRYSAFYNCSHLTEIVLQNGVTSIGDLAFQYCTNLASATIGNGVKSIGKQAFYHCTSLSSVTIPDSITSIGFSAFNGCTSLASVTIPDSVTSIGEGAFRETSLVSVKIPDSVTSLGSKIFRGCTSLVSVTIGSGVTSLGESIFNGCTSLASVTIPDSVTSIEYQAFRETSLESITIPDSVASLGDKIFRDCKSLVSVTIGSGVTSIGEAVFYGCTSLASVTIGSNVTSIERLSFSGCTSLTSIIIPDSVTKIGITAFENCSALKTATFNGTATWYYTSSDDYTGGTAISSTDLIDSSKAATYLTSTYCNNYWYKE